MRQLLVSAVIAASAVASAPIASAAPPSVPSWTGFYAGANIGYGWGDAKTGTTGNGTSISFPAIAPLPNSFSFAGAHKQGVDGIIGGVQAGYNYQFSARWVLGFEADIQSSAQRGNRTFANSLTGDICNFANVGPPPVCTGTIPLIGSALTTYESKIDWFGTVRARLGWLTADQTLLYVTGGLAYGHVSVAGNLSIPASTSVPSTFGPGANAFSASKTNVGFAVGGGMEGQFAAWLSPNWTWKVDYLFIDLGSVDTSTRFSVASSIPDFTSLAGTMTAHTHVTDNIVRIGLNYRFP
jgi:outer membrane immunogenic protein